jgi:hypothetical protein
LTINDNQLNPDQEAHKVKMSKETIALSQAKILVDRLSRLSADSIWARRASGLRASLDKAVGQIENDRMMDVDHLQHLISLGFEMLERAGKEIPVPEDILIKKANHDAQKPHSKT